MAPTAPGDAANQLPEVAANAATSANEAPTDGGDYASPNKGAGDEADGEEETCAHGL